MVGAIIGDVIGSIYEFNNIKTKDFPLFQKEMEYTDDSILTLATAKWILDGCKEVAKYYADFALRYYCPMGGYGRGFQNWVIRATRQGDYSSYNSCGNGSAMRVAPVGWAFDTEKDVMSYSKLSAECTHNHPGGIAGAQATALCILWSRQGKTKDFIKNEIESRFGFNLNHTVEELQKVYSWEGMPDEEYSGATCQGSVPQAIICALEAKDYEDAIRNAISIGGDSDTIACITGGIADALYGIPANIVAEGLRTLPDELVKIADDFCSLYHKSTNQYK